MSHEFGSQLYNRSIGRSYDPKLLKGEIDAGHRGEHPSKADYGSEYVTGHAPSRHERPVGSVEVLTDERTHAEWLEIAGQKVTDLIGRLNENQLKKEDIDLGLVDIVASIVEEERAKNEALSDEHPKMTAALGEWLARDEAFQTAETPEQRGATSIEFYESVMVELTDEKTTYESELGMWIENNQNQPRIDELINGIAQYNQFIEIANHQRMEELASLYKTKIEELYDLAA